MDRESGPLRPAAARLGRKAQVGGGLAAFVGILLLVVTPSAPPGAPVRIQQMAETFIAIGVALAAVGTFARWYYMN